MELAAGVLLRRPAGLDRSPAVGSDLMTFHCDQCHTVVGDSLSVCGELPSMEAIMLLRVTDSVRRSAQTESKMEREMTQCLHRGLECAGCSGLLGSLVEAAPRHLETLRCVFLLYKENINCYVLQHSRMVKSSEVVFDLKPIGESLRQAVEQFQAQLDHMTRLRRRLRKHAKQQQQ